MRYPAANLFRVKLHLADAAVAAAHEHTRARFVGKDGIAGTRLISVKLLAAVGVLAEARAPASDECVAPAPSTPALAAEPDVTAPLEPPQQ